MRHVINPFHAVVLLAHGRAGAPLLYIRQMSSGVASVVPERKSLRRSAKSKPGTSIWLSIASTYRSLLLVTEMFASSCFSIELLLTIHARYIGPSIYNRPCLAIAVLYFPSTRFRDWETGPLASLAMFAAPSHRMARLVTSMATPNRNEI